MADKSPEVNNTDGTMFTLQPGSSGTQIATIIFYVVLLVWAAVLANRQQDCRVLNMIAALLLPPLYIVSDFIVQP